MWRAVSSWCETKSGASDHKGNQQTSQESLVQQERQASRACGQCLVSQTGQKRARHFWGLKKKKQQDEKQENEARAFSTSFDA